MPQPSSPHIATVATVPDGLFWAKLHPRESPSTYHPLLAHSADVAAVMHRLLRPDSVLADRLAHSAGLDTLPFETISRLVYMAGLHDLGKVNHSFQDQWKSRPNRSRGHVRVVLQSLAYRPLGQVLHDVLVPLRLPPDDGFEMLLTTICHHGRPWQSSQNPVIPIWQDTATRKPISEIMRLARHAAVWSGIELDGAGDSSPITPTFLHLYAGILTLADWIGSTQSAFPPSPLANDDPNAYWVEAQQQADRACAIIGLTPRTVVTSLAGLPLLEHIFPNVLGAARPDHLADARATPLQLRIADMHLPEPGSVVLVESETGSGKTEAALAFYSRLRTAGRVGGLTFCLPTRATATAMRTRVATAIEAMYDPDVLPTFALAMGGDQARSEIVGGDAGSRHLMADEPDTYPDPTERDLVRWSSDSAKKFFAAEIVVGTLDQLLLGGLAVKHAHLRLAAFSRHLLVIDELHSYDRYMAEVLQHLLDMHRAIGGTSLLMSATLSDRERLRFGGLVLGNDDEQSSFDEAVSRPYPVIAVSTLPGTPWTDIPLAPANGPPKPPLHWALCREAAGMEQALRAAQTGARVCILRNTVKGARSTIQALLETEMNRDLLWRPEGSLHTPCYHSRYTLPDRMALDAAVLESYGRGPAGGAGHILVATQVAEQSLDVDFDIMITDLCPIDVLLQRMGRVWRHRERDSLRPAHVREVQTWIIEPDGGFEPLASKRFGGPNGWGTVYCHLGFLELTRRTISDHRSVEVPRDNRALIESVYHASRLDELRQESDVWEDHFQKQEGETLSHELTAKGVVIRFADAYSANADRFDRDIAGPIRTRLGDDRVRVLLPSPLKGFYSSAQTAAAADVPWRELNKVNIPAEALEAPRAAGGIADSRGTSYDFNGFSFRYGPQGWEWIPD